ncbi:hypothetical protein B7P43_G02717 [Cryptotermes secundus]|uniref:Mos1 transposase HTH domain-containing protein n=1 Tax=Cryptotermes secundus TaxID=105785 RepID=A0A2J7RQH3_9NEOP|nr:hypothetical protein B7P43_G02717 [Cryptotermes secundus]
MLFRQRAVIEFLVKDEIPAAEIHHRLRRANGSVCMGASSVRRWVKHFKDGNTSIEDEPRSGRPRTTSTERNKVRLDEIIEDDRRVTVDTIARKLGIGHSTVQEMIESLGYRKVCARRVPLLLTEDHKDKRRGRNIIILHDNARPHAACHTLEAIAKMGWEVLPRPSYSPDLAPSDYHLFGFVKHQLRGQRFEGFETRKAIQKAMRQCLRMAGTEFYRISQSPSIAISRNRSNSIPYLLFHFMITALYSLLLCFYYFLYCTLFLCKFLRPFITPRQRPHGKHRLMLLGMHVY